MGLALAALLAAGCGGGSGGGDGKTAASGSGGGEATAGGTQGDSGSQAAGEGDEGGVSVQAGSLSKEEFVKRAGAICRLTQERARGRFLAFAARNRKVPSSGPKLEAKVAEFVDRVGIPTFEEQIEKIRELGAPSGDEEQVEAILAAMRGALQRGHEDPTTVIRSHEDFLEPSRLANEYGLKACSTNPSR
jgi:hypothetical protein